MGGQTDSQGLTSTLDASYKKAIFRAALHMLISMKCSDKLAPTCVVWPNGDELAGIHVNFFMIKVVSRTCELTRSDRNLGTYMYHLHDNIV